MEPVAKLATRRLAIEALDRQVALLSSVKDRPRLVRWYGSTAAVEFELAMAIKRRDQLRGVLDAESSADG